MRRYIQRENRRRLDMVSRKCRLLIQENARIKRELAVVSTTCTALSARLFEERARDLARSHMQVQWKCSQPANMAPRILSFDETLHYRPAMTAAYAEFCHRPFFIELRNIIHHRDEYRQCRELEVDSVGSLDSIAVNTRVEFNSPFQLEREVHRNLLCLVESTILPMNVSIHNVRQWLGMFNASLDLTFHADWMKLLKEENRSHLAWLVKLEGLFAKLFQLETLLGVPDVPLDTTVILLISPEPPTEEVLAYILLENQLTEQVFKRLAALFQNGRFQTLSLPK